MAPPLRAASTIGRNSKVAVLQPFLRQAAARRRPTGTTLGQRFPCPSVSFRDACHKLNEAVALIDSLGWEVVLKEVVPLRSVHHKFMFGTGKVSEMSGVLSASNANTVFVNVPLTRDQQKTLTASWGVSIMDRFRVILDIFAARARTKEAKLQVELAELKYEMVRLVEPGGGGRHSGYDRQGGAQGVMSGAGEKELEIHRRKLRDRMSEVSRDVEDVQKRREMQRRTRDRRREPTVALIGYTNVGKSTLLNRLSLGGGGSGASKGRSGAKGAVHARDRLFDTLDPTSRSVTLPSLARCVIVDTVGFVQDLPTALVHSFRATLEEVRQADFLLHVRDASLSPRISEVHRAAVEETLRELGAADIPRLDVWNKSDKEVDADEHESEDELDDATTEFSAVRDSPAEFSVPIGACAEREDSQIAMHAVDGRSGTTGGESNNPKIAARALLSTVAKPEEPLRISAHTGEGLSRLLARVDLLLNTGGQGRLAPRAVEQYRYVRVLPGQPLHG